MAAILNSPSMRCAQRGRRFRDRVPLIDIGYPVASEILINVGAGEIRVALVVDGRLEDYSCERLLGGEARSCHSHVGDIVLGRVQRVLPGMQAAFVEIGFPRAGFLALGDVRPADGDVSISDCLHEGEALLVQIIKEPIGEKGPRLSACVTLPGRLLVMTPGQPGLALSRRIEAEDQRAALLQMGESLRQDTRLAPETGFIFRTAAVGASLEELTQDALALEGLRRGIDDKRKTARPPATLYRDLGFIERILRDMMRGEVTRVLIDDAAAAEAARDYCRAAIPGGEARIEFVREDLFERHDLEDEIARLSGPRVELAAGGWITIEATEALTAIDVNSGSFTQASGLEETGLAVNLEAAREIGRQIRLRGIGGLIVVDFIHMTLLRHRDEVVAALAQSLAFDRAPVQIAAMAEFGIVAVTRKRVREPLALAISQSCGTCEGTGRVLTAESVAQRILRRVEREARAWPGRELLVTAAPAVAQWLNGQGAGEALARRGAGRVRFEAGAMAGEVFDVRPL
jgi:ribonuclease G